MKLTAIPGYILAKVLSDDIESDTGIILKESQHNRHVKCEAAAVGDVYISYKGKKVDPPCGTGDTIYIRKPTKHPDITLDRDKYYKIQFIEVLAFRRKS